MEKNERQNNGYQRIQKYAGTRSGYPLRVPIWVPRPSNRSGKRIRLHPNDYYAMGLKRGAIRPERTLKFAWLAPLVWDEVFAVIASGQVDLSPIITHRFLLEDAEEGIKSMKESKEPKIKGVIVMD